MPAKPCAWPRTSCRCEPPSCSVPELTKRIVMKADKVRNLTDEELSQQERELNDQLFKLKFQLNMGQTESLKKIRGLRRDIARVKTIARERGVATGVTTVSTTEKK